MRCAFSETCAGPLTLAGWTHAPRNAGTARWLPLRADKIHCAETDKQTRDRMFREYAGPSGQHITLPDDP
eukprot:10267473-Lingulodinium_polyedra.AAC.1